MLEIKNLSKKYKNASKYSVKNLSMKVNDGEIFGFLGKNGAGKSTTIKCMTGISPFDEGSISICGYDVAKEPIKAKLNIGYVPDNHAVYENLTGREYVTYMGNIYQVRKDIIEQQIRKYGAKFNIAFALDSQICSYSHGMKQKICIMAALVHNPKFWVLDEPMMGLDPQSTFEIKQCMLEHKNAGNTVFFSSHNLEIVEKLCDRLAVLDKGKLVEIIDVKEFLKTSPVSLEEYFLTQTKSVQPTEEQTASKKSKISKKEKTKKTTKSQPQKLEPEAKKETKEQKTRKTKTKETKGGKV